MPVHASQPRNTQLRATISAVTGIGADIRILRLQPEKQLQWKAGQYIEITFEGHPPRPYSIASAPGSALEIHIKRGKGAVSGYVMDELREGAKVTLAGPAGDNIYDETIQCPVLAIAGGLGIAPIKAIADTAAQEGFQQPFTLVWGMADDNENYLKGYFEKYVAQYPGFKFIPVSGSPVTETVARDFDDFAAWHIYVSGPPAMITAMVQVLRDKGADPAKISYDRHPEAANLKP